MANPYETTGRRRNPYEASSRRHNPYASGEEDLVSKEAELRQMAEEHGARTIPSEKPGLFQRLLDIANREEYAMAGGIEELLSGRSPVEAARRAGREFFSGAGGLKGKKVDYPLLLEKKGVPELGKVEFDIPGPEDEEPGLFSGKEAALERGLREGRLGRRGPKPPKVPVKITGRGALGLGLSIGGVPSTYLTFGAGAVARIGKAGARKALTKKGEKLLAKELAGVADEIDKLGLVGQEKRLAREAARADAEARVLAAAETNPKLLDKGGIKFAGRTIPGTPQLATVASGVSSNAIKAFGRTKAGAGALEAVRALKPVFDKVGETFNRDWRIRNLPAEVEAKQAYLDMHAFNVDEWHKKVANSAVMNVPEKRFVEFAHAVEDGSWKVKYANEPEMLQAAIDFRKLKDERFQAEVEAGLMGPDPVKVASLEKKLAAVKTAMSDEATGAFIAERRLRPSATSQRIAEIERDLSPEVARVYAQADRGSLERASQEIGAMEEKVAGRGATAEALRDEILSAHKKDIAALDAEKRRLIDAAYGDKRLTASLPGKLAPLSRQANRLDDVLERRLASIDAQLEKSSGVSIDRLSQMRQRFDESLGAKVSRRESILIRRLERLKLQESEALSKAASRRSGTLRRAHDRLNSELQDALASRYKENYFAHFYENPSEDFANAAYFGKGRKLNLGTIGRHAEDRVYDSLKEAVETSTRLSKTHKEVKPLRPIYDPVEVLRRRGENGLAAIDFQNYAKGIIERHGGDVAFNANDFFDLVKPSANLHPAEWKAVKEAVDTGATDIKKFQAFSKDGKREFMRQRLLRTKDPLEVINVLEKYGMENAPKMTSLLGKLAEDGTPYVSFNSQLFKGLDIPKSIADDLADMSEHMLKSKDVSKLLKWFDTGNNIFKSGVTTYFPAFYTRNAYSNVAQMFVDIGLEALSPVRHAQAIRVLSGAKGEFITKLGERYTYDEIRQLLGELQIKVSGRELLEHTAQPGLRTAGRIRKGLDVKGTLRGIGGATETEARTHLFLSYLRRGMDPRQAAARVKEFLYDYKNMSQTEKEWFSRAIPFYRFTRMNVMRQLKNLKYRPGMVGVELKPFRGRQQENESITQWDSEALKMRLNKDGKTLRILSGVDLPVKQLDLIRPGRTLKNAASMLTPFAKMPLEVIAGKSFFTDREFGRKESNAVGKAMESLHLPKAMLDYFGYDKKIDKAGRESYTFDGERFYIWLQSWALSRAISTTDRQLKALKDGGWGPVILDFLTGLQDKTLNLDEEQDKRLKNTIRELEKVGEQRGYLKRFEKTYEPRQ